MYGDVFGDPGVENSTWYNLWLHTFLSREGCGYHFSRPERPLALAPPIAKVGAEHHG